MLLAAHRDTWSHQRRRRREIQRLSRQVANVVCPPDDGPEEPGAKRRRVDEICAEAAALDCSQSESHSSEATGDECVLKCTLNVAIVVVDNFPTLQMQARYLDGRKEAMNQVLTFVKNALQKAA